MYAIKQRERPVNPIKYVGNRHLVLCSDGYLYYEKRIKEKVGSRIVPTSPTTRQPFQIVIPCKIFDKGLND